MSTITLQWIILIAASLALFAVSPWARSTKDFFRGSKEDQEPGFWLLTSSLVISWLFAKSITNAANLGLSFGFVGAVGYGTYYLSFVAAGLIIYQMRVKGGFQSIHEFLLQKFGRTAIMIFSLLIGIRLMNEVWSNTMVIGSYFGDSGTSSYFLAIGVFTALTVAYTLKGGLRSSLLTDVIQMVLFGVLLFVILGMIMPEKEYAVTEFTSSGTWSLEMGGNLILVALLQVLSYPFHDPVLTDRGFISNPGLTKKAFLAAAGIGGVCILLFSFVGIYARMEGLSGQAPVEVAKVMGVAMMLMINFIMVTSAASTLDSTFNSFSKLIVLDLKMIPASIGTGRWIVALIAVLGNIPILLGAEILSATTVSGTMVIGLTPIFLFWNKPAPSLSFILPVGFGLLVGILIAIDAYPTSLHVSDGKYADLLSANLLGLIGSVLLYFLPIWLTSKKTLHEQLA